MSNFSWAVVNVDNGDKAKGVRNSIHSKEIKTMLECTRDGPQPPEHR